jgi:hypothetical protein
MNSPGPSIERSTCFGGEVHHRAGRVLVEQRAQRCTVADVDLAERIARIAGRLGDGGEIGRVGELVDIDDESLGIIEEVSDHRRADEAGAAGHEDGLVAKPHRCPRAIKPEDASRSRTNGAPT